MVAYTPNQIMRVQRSSAPILLAEGDSWFNYLTMKKKYGQSDLLTFVSEHLNYNIISFAQPGDTMRNMASLRNISYITDRLSYIFAASDKLPLRVKGFLVSGGGNDLFDHLGNVIGANGLDEIKLSNLMTMLLNKYKGFMASFAHLQIPFFVHTYACPFPSGIGYKNWFLKCGPWIKPILDRNNISQMDGYKIMEVVISEFHDMLCRLREDEHFDMHVVNLMHEVGPSDWENEIHLTPDALYRIAGIMAERIEEVVNA